MARFNQYRSIRAKFSSTGKCGHAITKGDLIGWSPRGSETCCAACWSRWQAENAEAEAYEYQHSYMS
jgi:hypothetical protein